MSCSDPVGPGQPFGSKKYNYKNVHWEALNIFSKIRIIKRTINEIKQALYEIYEVLQNPTH